MALHKLNNQGMSTAFSLVPYCPVGLHHEYTGDPREETTSDSPPLSFVQGALVLSSWTVEYGVSLLKVR